GLRASVRGIDLILEEGMNVKVCTFPNGDDPDSFAKRTSYDELLAYLENNAKDFIQFKASLLMDESKNDPIKKAELIRDMVMSISKIPDRIKREIYIQETSRIMDISEQVLASTLAQLVQKDLTDAGKKFKEEQKEKVFDVVKNEEMQAANKVDVLFELERKIIGILLLYGNVEDEFEDVMLKADEEGELKQVSEMKSYKVFDRIYLSLQEDETELANPLFRTIYNNVIEWYRDNGSLDMDQYLMRLEPEMAREVTNILMEDEKETLHNWEVKQIMVKDKNQTIAQYVQETILTLRWFLVDRIINELKDSLSASQPDTDNTETLSMAIDYQKLISSFSSKLGRVMSRYS
ncbi:MAG: DNA primase, partial [Flavobacterium sp.]